MDGTAIILTNGSLTDGAAKTAHGLIRGSERYKIAGIIDPVHAGMDAGEVLDGKRRNIPVFASLDKIMDQFSGKIDYCLIGIAPKGGKLPLALKGVLKQCIRNGISVVSGLHDFISDMPDLAKLAAQYHVTITDIRKPKPRKESHFWTGKIFDVTALTVAVLGMDTNLGKRTTCRFLTEACRKAKLNAQMVSTGQTGWMQDGKFGFVLDTTVNDFVSGELEHAIYTCFKITHPDVIFVEGQSGLRNPSGPCGSEYLLSGNIHHVILQHAPKRVYFGDKPQWGRIPPVEKEIELIKLYGAKVIALSLNTKGCTAKEAKKYQQKYTAKLKIPVLLPLEEGVDSFIPVIRKLIK